MTDLPRSGLTATAFMSCAEHGATITEVIMVRLSIFPRLRSRTTSGTRTLACLPAASFLAGALTLVGGTAMAPDAAQATSDTPRTGRVTPACAVQDLRAITMIEERGEDAKISPERLTEAGFQFLQARILCLSGRENEAIALYRSTIDSIGVFDVSVDAGGNAIGRVKQ